MAYATQADMIALFGENIVINLTDRAATGSINTAVLASAITSAEGEIDSYIGAVYELPLPSTTDMLMTVCCNIARFRLMALEASEEVKIRYEDSIRWLRDVARGVATLGLKTTDVQPVGGPVVVQSRTQVFTDDIFDKMNLA